MFSSILTASFVAALVPQAFAKLYLTSPVASTTCQANQACNVAWNDDNTKPSLSDIGPCAVGLFVGSQTTQILLQDLGNVDVSQQATANFNPNPSIGGNSDLYFIRFTSAKLMDGQYPYQSFSAKFTLTGMTGTFNDTEKSLMTAPTSAIGSTTSPLSTTSSGSTPANTNTNTGSSSRLSSTTTSKPTGATSSPGSSPTSSQGAAVPAFGSSPHAAALAAVIVSAFFAAAAF